MSEAEKIGNAEAARRLRAISVIKARARGASWVKAWKLAAPHSKANDKSASDQAKRTFEWYRENYREELEEMLNAYDLDATFIAHELRGMILNSKVRIGTEREYEVKRDKKGNETGRIIKEKPIMARDARAINSGLTLLTELRGLKNGNGTGHEGPSRYIIVLQGKVKKKKPKMRRVGHGNTEPLSKTSDAGGKKEVQDHPRSTIVRRLRGSKRS